jgi:hypothetical protein
MWRVVAVIVELAAYMMFIVDRVPSAGTHDVEPTIRFTGTPTVRSALARIVMAVPSAFVFSLLGCFAWIAGAAAAAFVLVGVAIPEPLLAYQRGVLRWLARLLAYHTSLVAEYPPWTFETAPALPPAALANAR